MEAPVRRQGRPGGRLARMLSVDRPGSTPSCRRQPDFADGHRPRARSRSRQALAVDARLPPGAARVPLSAGRRDPRASQGGALEPRPRRLGPRGRSIRARSRVPAIVRFRCIDLDVDDARRSAERLASELARRSGSRATTDGLADSRRARAADATRSTKRSTTPSARSVAPPGAPAVTGRMRLVQAIAHRWRGAHHDAARCAFEAMELHPRGSRAWFEAAAELAVASGLIGERDRLGSARRRRARTPQPEGDERAAGRVVAAFRIATWLLRTGQPDRAGAVCAAVLADTERVAPHATGRRRAGTRSTAPSYASHHGDPGASLTHLAARGRGLRPRRRRAQRVCRSRRTSPTVHPARRLRRRRLGPRRGARGGDRRCSSRWRRW